MSFHTRRSRLRRFCSFVIALLCLAVPLSAALAEGTREIVRGGHWSSGDTDPYDHRDSNCYNGSGGSGSVGDSIGQCPYQGLRRATTIWVDIEDDDEFAVWCSGKDVDVTVFAQNGTEIGTFSRGERITFPEGITGDYRFRLPSTDDLGTYSGQLGDMLHRQGSSVKAKFPWDIQVFAPTCSLSVAQLCPDGMGGSGDVDRGADCERNGRVFSTQWNFNTGSFGEDTETNASWYVVVPGGADDDTAVTQLDLDGLAGNVYEIWGNRLGVAGQGGRSVPDVDGDFDPEFPIYLNPPEDADYRVTAPVFETPVDIRSGELCTDIISPGFPVTFSFDSNAEGTIQLICDLNDDHLYDLSSDEDVQVFGVLTDGTNEITWDVTTNDGEPIPVDGDSRELRCILRLTVGEFHYVGKDIETSDEGFRIFRVNRSGTAPDATYTRQGLAMYWNDTPVFECAVPMDSGNTGAATSATGDLAMFVTGVNSGNYDAAAVSHTTESAGNARAWGNYAGVDAANPPCSRTDQGSGRGNDAYLDTLTWMSDVASDEMIFTVIPERDTDGEGLFDYVEQCITGTEYDNCDTDGDTVNDFAETEGGVPGIDTDLDGDDDALDEDDDNDCIPTLDEAMDGVDSGACVLAPVFNHHDSDGEPDYLDDDDDGDNVPTIEEGTCGETSFTPQNTDGDDDPDHLDDDDDGDTVPTKDEDVENVNDDPTDDDTDLDGTPNYLDDDDDDDCILTRLEDPGEDGNVQNDDTDLDDHPNYLDDDDDGDTVPTLLEGECNDDGTVFTEWNTDGDDDPDHLDINDDGDARDTIDEDPNGNGDPTDDDSDGDGTKDYLDPDDEDGPLGDRDGDGVPNQDDNCPDTPNADQANIDADDMGDVCDPDIDGDEILNDDDNCPYVHNVDQADFDNDDDGDVCDPDRDGDGILNEDDNCADTPNPEQEDVNLDGVGDICQADSDLDGIPDVSDNCVDTPNFDQGNVDGDDDGDVCDDDIDDDGLTNDEETDTYGTDPVMADTGGGGVPDGVEVDRRTDPLDPGDDPGPYEISGGSVFTCTSANTRANGWLGFVAVLVGLVAVIRRRENQ